MFDEDLIWISLCMMVSPVFPVPDLYFGFWIPDLFGAIGTECRFPLCFRTFPKHMVLGDYPDEFKIIFAGNCCRGRLTNGSSVLSTISCPTIRSFLPRRNIPGLEVSCMDLLRTVSWTHYGLEVSWTP